MRGVLITFEGVEGSGKSTQAERLTAYLQGRGLNCLLSREPGGTDIGERVRGILLDPTCRRMEGATELFLYLASRNQLVREKVLPALRIGRTVVLDRFADSSVAYQGYGRELGERLVARLNRLATGGLRPGLTILVDVPVAVGRSRKDGSELDRLEQERVEFHERIRAGYLRMAHRAPGRIKVVDGRLSPSEIEAKVRSHAEAYLMRKGKLH